MSQGLDQKEILIIDDFSGIETALFIKKMKEQKGSLSYYKVKTNLPGKKQALKEGLSVARFNFVLLTDADCSPKSNNWAKLMTSATLGGRFDVILGYSPYSVLKKTWLNLWIHFEAWMTGVLYLSFCLRGLPYMGVGRNLLYNKSILPPSALTEIKTTPSGDDDLLISQISTVKNTSICIDPNSFCYTYPSPSWSSYFKQKKRHYSTATHYKIKHQLLLGTFSLSQILFFVLSFLAILNNSVWIPIVLYIIRVLIITFIGSKLMRLLKAEFSKTHLLLFDILLSIYYVLFSFTFLFPKQKEW